eukprot:scaffold93872_cov65-Attheya_sp.AAC.3
MKRAKITDRTAFAQRTKNKFLKGPWGKAFIEEFEDNQNFRKLWWGQTKYIVLGTASMTALKNTQNAMGKRIVDTTVHFIEYNKGEDGTGREIMIDLFNVINFRRDETYSYKRCLDLFGLFCITKELNSTLKMKTQNNLAGKDYGETVNEVRLELEGNILQDKISSA